MRHRKTTPQLGRSPSHRKAMLRNMVTDFLRYGKIRTTEAKAKALRPYAEKLITAAKKDTLHARRQAARHIRDKEALKRLFETIGPRFAERPGGYTRLYHLGHRPGDAADMALIELVDAQAAAPAESEATPAKAGEGEGAADAAGTEKS